MKRLINLLLVVVIAVTLSACAATTNPVVDSGGMIGTEAVGP